MESQSVELFQAQFERRSELTALVDARAFSDRARRFLTLAINAAFEQAAPGVRCRWLQQRLWLHAEQSRLGELLECSDRTIREMIRVELEPLGFLKRIKSVPLDSGPPREVLIYVIDIERLKAVPVLDATDPIDAAILSTCGDPWAGDVETEAHNLSIPPTSGGSSGATSGGSSGGSSGATSGGSSGGSSGLSKNPVLSCPVPAAVKFPSFPPDQEQEGGNFVCDFQENGPTRPFNSIPPDHIRAIGGFSPNGEQISDAIRLEYFESYLRDAVKAGFATPRDAPVLLAIFRVAAQRMPVDVPASQRLRDPAMWIRAVWNNRHTKPPLKNAAIAKAMLYASSLLDPPAAITKAPAIASPAVIDLELEQAIADRVAELQTMDADARRQAAAAIPVAFVRKRLLQTNDWTPMMLRDAAKAMIEHWPAAVRVAELNHSANVSTSAECSVPKL